MWQYVTKRVLLMIPTLVGAALVIFLLMHIVPGDIALLVIGGDQGGDINPRELERLREQLGLNRPLYTQFLSWLWGVVQLDFGKSLWTGAPIMEELLIRLPLTLQVAIMATIVSTIIAIPLGTIAAIRQDTWIDYVVRVVSIGGLAIPSFWTGILIILFLVIFFEWGPPLEFVPFTRDPWENFQQLVWPIVSVGYRYAAVTTRMTRSTVLEVMREDYVRTAWAKGLQERVVVVKHALKNAILPVITIIGTEFAFLIGGLVVTETVFTLNGVGRFMVDAISHRDIPVVQTLVLLIAFTFVFVNLIIDLLYAWLDPPDQLPVMGEDMAVATRQPHMVEMEDASSSRRIWGNVCKFILTKPLGAAGAVVIVIMALAAIFADAIVPYDAYELNQRLQFGAPNLSHWFGTDEFGRDVFTRIVYGARIALFIGFASSLMGATGGAIIGVVSAYIGGRTDLYLQRFMDIMLSFPLLILALAIVTVLGRSIPNLIIAIAIPVIPRTARIVRSSALVAKENVYVEAARAVGSSHIRVMFRHIVPNILAPYLIVLTAQLGSAILTEASLSFLGLGTAEPTPSWGLMLSGGAPMYAEKAPWLAIFPGVAISMAVFGFNLFGDSLRDALDPRLRHRS